MEVPRTMARVTRGVARRARSRMPVSRAAFASAAAATESLASRVAELSAATSALEARVDAVASSTRALNELASLHTLIALKGPLEGPLVSVVLATRDRRPLLERAIASVRRQTYEHWELIVVADSCTDDTPSFLSSLAANEPRIRPVGAHVGRCGAARNAGLEIARGDIVCYLDDDNLYHPRWLQSVVWAFDTYPQHDVLYGAMVLDHADRADAQAIQTSTVPRLNLHGFDRQGLRNWNLCDTSTIAHRASHPQGRFDPDLTRFGDWEILSRLVADHDPLVLPAIAAVYTTEAPDRLSAGHAEPIELAKARALVHAALDAGRAGSVTA